MTEPPTHFSYAQEEGRRVLVAIREEGAEVSVPVGADTWTSPSGRRYALTWGQDERGALHFESYRPAEEDE